MLEMTGKYCVFVAHILNTNNPLLNFFSLHSPVFEGIFDFCSMYTGASLDSAWKLNNEVFFTGFSILQVSDMEWVVVISVSLNMNAAVF